MKRGKNDHKQPCACGKERGFITVWRDEAGVDHVECDACRGPPRMPYHRGPEGLPETPLMEDETLDGN